MACGSNTKSSFPPSLFVVDICSSYRQRATHCAFFWCVPFTRARFWEQYWGLGIVCTLPANAFALYWTHNNLETWKTAATMLDGWKKKEQCAVKKKGGGQMVDDWLAVWYIWALSIHARVFFGFCRNLASMILGVITRLCILPWKGALNIPGQTNFTSHLRSGYVVPLFSLVSSNQTSYVNTRRTFQHWFLSKGSKE